MGIPKKYIQTIGGIAAVCFVALLLTFLWGYQNNVIQKLMFFDLIILTICFIFDADTEE